MTLPSIGEPPSNLKRRKPCAPWGWMHVCARVLLHKAARLWALLQLVHHRNKDVLVRRLPIAASCCLLQALGRVCARLGGGVRAVAFPDVRPVRGAEAGAGAAGAKLGMNLATSRPGNENGPRVGARFAGCMAERAGFEPAVGISPHTLSRRAT